MARIQHSIEVNVPVRTLYQQLTRFEDYPQFMDNVEKVQQIDETHLHWTTKMANRPVEWDAEITKQEADRCIAWHGADGPSNAGKVEVEALSSDASKATFIFDVAPGQFPGVMAGDTEQEMARHLSDSLEKLKDFVEAGDPERAARRAEQATTRIPATSISGSPTELLEDEPNESGPGSH
jgi:uncharacterized membrane protein